MKEKNGAFRTSIGGQALIEGILMRGPKKQAIVICSPESEGGFIVKEEELHPIKEKYPILGWPLIRGVVNFIDSMRCGVKALAFSASCLPEEDQEQPSKFELWLDKKIGSARAEKLVLGFAMVLGVVFAVGLFFLLPTLLAGLLKDVTDSRFLKNLAEGIIRIAIFLGYIFLATRMKDIHRVFEFHGAEHKSIHCYEKGLPLTVENVRVQPRQHPRCGTSFIFVVMIISMLVLFFVTWSSPLLRMLIRLLLLPVIVAISYEINRWVGRHDNWLSRILAAPGKALQHLTVYEPDEKMMETAIKALELVIPEEKGSDAW